MAKDKREIDDGKKRIVESIKDGIVIDHISKSLAPLVLLILEISPCTDKMVISAMNVKSEKYTTKDIVKIVGKQEFDEREINMISIIAPHATISIIKNYKITDKWQVELPALVEGLIKCSNDSCITNDAKEARGAISRFVLTDPETSLYRCKYCEREIKKEEIMQNLMQKSLKTPITFL